jgi:hypothetical protein
MDFASVPISLRSVEADTVNISDLASGRVVVPHLVRVAGVTLPHEHLPSVAVPLTRVKADAFMDFDLTSRGIVLPSLICMKASDACPHVHMPT